MRVKNGSLPMLFTLCLLLLSLGLAACGSRATTGSGSAYPTSATATPAPQSTAAAVPTSALPLTPTVPVVANTQKCGIIVVTLRGAVENAGLSTQVGDCFWQAFQQCRPASLGFNVASLDTTAAHTFTIGKKGGSCVISDSVQHFIAPNHLMSASTYTCAALNNTNGMLVFSGCGKDGTVSVPIAGMSYNNQ